MSNRGAIPNLIRRNDWTDLDPPELVGWAPTLRVSVVLAGDAGQERLNVTLAALRHQSYPAGLLDVIVVEETPAAGLELPKIRPEHCRIVTVGSGALDAGVAASDADVVVRLASGTICAPDFVSELVRWQHASPDAVSIATPGRISGEPVSADEVADRSANNSLDQLFPASASLPEPELARLLVETNQLRTADHLGFLAVAGMPFAFLRDRYEPGADPHRGADVEVGYRLAQAGAVFVPEPQARAWLPASANGDLDAARGRRAELATLLPYPRGNRPAGGRTWAVPLVTAVVPAAGPYELVRTCVDRLLGGDETDLRVLVVGDWTANDPELRLIAAEYRSEPRVRLVETAPDTGFPSPYLLRVPARLGLGPSTVRALVAAAESWRVGLIRVLPAGATSAVAVAELWSTCALNRALRAGITGADLPAVVAETHGERWETGSEYDVTDLSRLAPAALESPAPRRAAGAPGDGRSETVPVGGARSLAKATAFVTRRYARAAKRRIARR